MNECHFGDCRDVLRRMIADGVKVNMVATSPPYWGLRDYGTATWEGGDDSGCDHIAERIQPHAKSSSGLGFPADGGPRRIGDENTYHEAYTKQFRDLCGKCGAKRIDS